MSQIIDLVTDKLKSLYANGANTIAAVLEATMAYRVAQGAHATLRATWYNSPENENKTLRISDEVWIGKHGFSNRIKLSTLGLFSYADLPDDIRHHYHRVAVEVIRALAYNSKGYLGVLDTPGEGYTQTRMQFTFESNPHISWAELPDNTRTFYHVFARVAENLSHI